MKDLPPLNRQNKLTVMLFHRAGKHSRRKEEHVMSKRKIDDRLLLVLLILTVWSVITVVTLWYADVLNTVPSLRRR